MPGARSKTNRGATKKKRADEPSTIPLMGIATWTDPQRPPQAFVLEARFDPEMESAHVCLNVNLRRVSSLEIRPVRRPLLMKDGSVDPGHVEDAEKLANAT